MKKLAAVSLLVLFLVGCAWNQEQKNQFVTDAKAVLNTASLAEGGLYVVFQGLCAGGIIPLPACLAGATVDGVFKASLAEAMVALDNFAKGTIDQRTAQASVNEAIKKSNEAIDTMNKSIGTGTKQLMLRQAPKPATH